MKNIRCIVSTISVVMVLGLNISGNAQTPEEWEQKEQAWKAKAADAYVFPVRPGMPEWGTLKNYIEMTEACQIPENILQTISTEGLVETCLNYPLLGDITVYGDFKAGLEQVTSHFNGLQELLKRQDAGIVLFERYKIMDPDQEFKRWQEEHDLIPNFIKFSVIELLLAHDTIISQLPSQFRIPLLHESLRVFRSMERSEHYMTLGSTVFIMAKILEQINYQPLKQRIANIKKKDVETLRQEILQKRPDLKGLDFTPIPRSGHEIYQRFLQTGGWGSTELIDAIVSSAEQYLTETKEEGNL